MHFFSQSADALLRYEDHFSLKKCSGESVEEKVVGNVKENWNSKFVLKFNDIWLQKLRFFQKSQFFTCIMTLIIFLPQLHQWNFSAVVARWPYNLKVLGSSPADTTIFFFFMYWKRIFGISVGCHSKTKVNRWDERW